MPLLAVEHNIMIPLSPDNLESEPMEQWQKANNNPNEANFFFTLLFLPNIYPLKLKIH